METPEKSKQELFNENPDKFICLDEVVVMIRKEDGKLGIFINGTAQRGDVIRGLGELQIKVVRDMILADAIKEQGKVVQPGGIISAARNRLFKK